jgi:hypothetical protein
LHDKAPFIDVADIFDLRFFCALAAKNPFPCLGIAFGIWALFLWGYNRRPKLEAEKRLHYDELGI